MKSFGIPIVTLFVCVMPCSSSDCRICTEFTWTALADTKQIKEISAFFLFPTDSSMTYLKIHIQCLLYYFEREKKNFIHLHNILEKKSNFGRIVFSGEYLILVFDKILYIPIKYMKELCMSSGSLFRIVLNPGRGTNTSLRLLTIIDNITPK